MCWGTDTYKQTREAWLFGTPTTDLNASAIIKVTARHDKFDRLSVMGQASFSLHILASRYSGCKGNLGGFDSANSPMHIVHCLYTTNVGNYFLSLLKIENL